MEVIKFNKADANIVQAIGFALKKTGYISLDAEDFIELATNMTEIEFLILEEDKELILERLKESFNASKKPNLDSRIIFSIIHSEKELTMIEIGDYTDAVYAYYGKNSNITWGVSMDPNLKDNQVKLILFRSGF